MSPAVLAVTEKFVEPLEYLAELIIFGFAKTSVVAACGFKSTLEIVLLSAEAMLNPASVSTSILISIRRCFLTCGILLIELRRKSDVATANRMPLESLSFA